MTLQGIFNITNHGAGVHPDLIRRLRILAAELWAEAGDCEDIGRAVHLRFQSADVTKAANWLEAVL